MEAPPTPSPTGKPLIDPKFVPYITSIAVIALMVSGLGEMEVLSFLTPKAVKLAEGVAALCLLVLGMSPGQRVRGAAAIATAQALQASQEPKPEEPKS